jgi:hypothetical protein
MSKQTRGLLVTLVGLVLCGTASAGPNTPNMPNISVPNISPMRPDLNMRAPHALRDGDLASPRDPASTTTKPLKKPVKSKAGSHSRDAASRGRNGGLTRLDGALSGVGTVSNPAPSRGGQDADKRTDRRRLLGAMVVPGVAAALGGGSYFGFSAALTESELVATRDRHANAKRAEQAERMVEEAERAADLLRVNLQITSVILVAIAVVVAASTHGAGAPLALGWVVNSWIPPEGALGEARWTSPATPARLKNQSDKSEKSDK